MIPVSLGLGTKPHPRCWKAWVWACLLVGCAWAALVPPPAIASSEKMKAPGQNARIHTAAGEHTHASGVAQVCLGAIRFYQKWISPIGGGKRCGFSPSCSAFGYKTVQEQGPAVGILMTADRLMRCNIWKRPGPDYTLLPSGTLYDPPSKNLLSED